VTFVPDVEKAPVMEVGAALQSHEAFPDGVNVEFVQVLGPGTLAQRTFERGSGETLACGTGACAAAVVALTTGKATGASVRVRLRGGDLTITRNGDSVELEGPAVTVFEGELDLVALGVAV
jgi:diaminopimelate epimerase